MELTLQRPIPTLWAKAVSEAKGDEIHAKALYLGYRMGQLRALHQGPVEYAKSMEVTSQRNCHVQLLLCCASIALFTLAAISMILL